MIDSWRREILPPAIFKHSIHKSIGASAVPSMALMDRVVRLVVLTGTSVRRLLFKPEEGLETAPGDLRAVGRGTGGTLLEAALGDLRAVGSGTGGIVLVMSEATLDGLVGAKLMVMFKGLTASGMFAD
jgi:hypothetical protein